MKSSAKITPPALASYILAILALWIILKAGLLVALFSGLLVYSLVHLLVPAIEKKFNNRQSCMIAVILLSIVIVVSLSVGIWALILFFRSDAGNLQNLLQKLADIIEASRGQLPAWLSAGLPEGVDPLKGFLIDWLREHAGEAKLLSQEAGHLVVHLLLGMIVGSMVVLQDVTNDQVYRPFAMALRHRIMNLAEMFHKVVFAQVRISLINTVFSGIYLALLLPLAGVNLPLTKSMIAITFLAGLVPVVGNIVSNTVIVIVSLSHSPQIAVISLGFMVVIHKLEYFLNARIIGAKVNAKSWELLTAILVMETLFGLSGVIAAPVFYAYIKKELRDQDLV
jgi:predicted PurR-regulated permease PerM